MSLIEAIEKDLYNEDWNNKITDYLDKHPVSQLETNDDIDF
jgi:hypothetical protein